MSAQEVEESFEQAQKLRQEPLFALFSVEKPQNSISNEKMKPESSVFSVWRSNQLLDDYEDLKIMEVPQLTHVTSFELQCIEDYGKQLSEEYIYYIGNLNQSLSPEELVEIGSTNGFDNESNLVNYISSTNDIREEDKNIILASFQQNLEVKQILMALAESMPICLLSGALILTSVILKKFADLKISNLDETQMETSLQINEENILKSCFQKMSLIGLAIDWESCEEDLKILVSSWMKIMASIMKGIYENPLKRRQVENDIVDDLRDLSGHKMIKSAQSSKY